MSLLARYDAAALRVEPLGAWARRPAPAAWHEWCRTALTEAAPPLALGLLPDQGPATWQSLEALSRELDGDDLLRALPSAAARWRLKLRVKAQDLNPWRRRRQGDIWDAGYLADTPNALAALAQFRPRRPTLMVADPMAPAELQTRLDLLRSSASEFAHPVRVLAVRSVAELRDGPHGLPSDLLAATMPP